VKDKSDLAKGWFAKAESDLVSAHHILAGPGPYDTVCFHSQQAVEKYMKGFLAFHGQPFPFTHALDRLAPLCERVNPTLSLTMPKIIGLTDYATALRYDADFWPTQQTATDAVTVAELVRNMIFSVIPPEIHP
jgi:HEPN domain-containing protein